MTVSAVTSRAAAEAALPHRRPGTVRVRDRVRDGVAVIAFSAAASTGIALCIGLALGILGS